MAINLSDNILAKTTAPADAKYGPYTGVDLATALTAAKTYLLSSYRYEGLTVGIKVGTDPIIEYWFLGGILDGNLVLKSSSNFSATFSNGINQINSGVYGLGGTFSQNTSINGNGFTFSITGANNITLTASTINLGQNVVINNAYTLPTTLGSSGTIMVSDGLGNSSWTSSNSLGLTKKHKDIRTFTASVTDTITHNLNSDDVCVQNYDSSGTLIIPGIVQIVGTGSVNIQFSVTLTNVKTIIIG